MSECVVRMEMPESCDKCPFLLKCSYCEGYNDVCVLAPDNAKYEWNLFDGIKPTEKPSWCPIVAVLPEKHGRLGELDELERKVNAARIRVMQSGGDTNPYWECLDLTLQTPTIVPATEGGNE